MLILVLFLITAQGMCAVTVTVEKCEELYSQLSKDDPWLITRDASALSWGEAGVIQGILDLYEATGDTKYLHEIVRRGDRMLSHRDDRRGVKDSTGKIRKAWSMGVKYTVAEGTLVDASGKPAIRLRSTPYAYNNQTKVEVTASGDSFTLLVMNEFWKRKETFSDLSTDPKSPRYFERIINNPAPTPGVPAGECTEVSQLIKVLPLGKEIGLPKPQSLTLESLTLAYCGYIGIIYNPLLRFAEIVRADASLKEFVPAANRFVKAADESYEDFKDHFRSGPGENEGYYITCERGGAFPYDNLPEPFNYLGMHVSSELILYRLTGKPMYKDHVTRMANLFKNRLKLADDRYIWYYWYEPLNTGYSREDDLSDNYPVMSPKPVIEDNSHATLNILLVLNAARAGIVFDKTDTRRVANTFLKNIYIPGSAEVNGRVDGSNAGEKYAKTGIFGWLPLAEIDPAVYDACLDIYNQRDRDAFITLARLLKWKKRLDK